MTGQFTHIEHLCDKPDTTKLGVGTRWLCECGMEWAIYETSAYGYYKGWYWYNRPQVIILPAKRKQLRLWFKHNGPVAE